MTTRMLVLAAAAALFSTSPARADAGEAAKEAHDALAAQAPAVRTRTDLPDVNEPYGNNSQVGDSREVAERDKSGELDPRGEVGEQGGGEGSSVEHTSDGQWDCGDNNDGSGRH